MLVEVGPKISIIIPIYNVENYLHQTLFSVTNQTLKNIEIICIEDCSTDMSAEILRKFAENDSRIRIIQHTYNQGVSIARREGILLSSGEYIMFLDGDDYLDVNACKELYKLIARERVDILQFGTTIIPRNNVKEDEINYVEKLLAPYDGKLSAKYNGDLNHYCFVEEKYGFTLWNKIYSGNIVREAVKYYPNERFNLAEDLHLFFLIAFFSKTYMSANKKYYYYNFGAGITGNKGITEDVLKDKIAQGKILNYIKNFVAELDPSENTEESIDAVANRFILDIVNDLLMHKEILSKNIVQQLFTEFDSVDILSSLLDRYYDGESTVKKDIINICKQRFTNEIYDKKIKTIATFYFRLNNGGIERVISRLIPIWISAGYRVVIFTDEIPSIFDYVYPKEVVRIVVPKIKKNTKNEYKQRINYLKNIIKKYEIDVMVYHASTSEFLLLDMLAFKSEGKPFLIHTHNFFAFDVKSPWTVCAKQDLMKNDIYSICDGIITLTDVDYSWWTLIHDNVYKTINPSTFDIYNVKPSKLENKNILWLGRISPEKKPLDALKIMQEIISQGFDAKLHFVGRADDENFYQLFLRTIDEMDIGEYVEIHGFHTDVNKFYENSSIFLTTSEFEGFQLTLVESKAYGLPVVTYNLPNLDLVREAQGMVVVAQNDISGAANAIIDLLENDEKRKKLGMQARKSVEELYNFDLEKFWIGVFDDISAKRINKHITNKEDLSIAVKMFVDFSLKGVEIREKVSYSNIEDNRAIEYKALLDDIYNMRTWKLIQKYRNFMDTTKLGHVFSKLRDLIFR